MIYQIALLSKISGAITGQTQPKHEMIRAGFHFEAGLESPDASFSFGCSG
jgi:hypothetical protein